ncbi:hypothetical protein KFU94_49955 [Chloroflexi bacterium TSY]|nr:hypothetical protein [Chloroflexi bacterium TSY]
MQNGNNRLLDLGVPPSDRIEARNAQPGDTLCIYDLAVNPIDDTSTSLTGCRQIQTTGERVTLATPTGGWLPDITIIPSSAQTLTIRVGNIVSPSLALQARLYPVNKPAYPAIDLGFDMATHTYTGTLTLPHPTLEAYLHIYAPDNLAQGVMVDYTLGGAPVLVLSDGDVLRLSNGTTVRLNTGGVITLGSGDVLVLSGGTAFIRRQNGDVVVLNDGDVLVLNDGDALRRQDGEVVVLNDGDVVVLNDGDIEIVSQNGEVVVLNDGDVVVLNDGDVPVLNDGDAAIQQLNGGEVVVLNDGDGLVLNDGAVVVLNDGDVLIFGDSEIPLAGGGEAIYFSHGSAPVRSSDGQVTLYGEKLKFKQGQFYTLQPAIAIPDPPTWATIVGQAYRITASPDAPDLNGLSISMNYIGRNVEDNNEQRLHVYYWDGSTWTELTTKVDDDHNIAFATVPGPGIYTLMYSYDVAISGEGWSTFAYPVAGSRPITHALASIDPYYQIVYHYGFERDWYQRWRVYAKPPVPDWVNSLHALEWNQTYGISATHPSSLTIKFADAEPGEITAAAVDASDFIPPAAYYGVLQPNAEFTPAAGMVVDAFIGNIICGRGTTRAVDGQIVFAVIVYTDGFGQADGCGRQGRKVRFEVDKQAMVPDVAWESRRLTEVSLSRAQTISTEEVLFVPVMMRQP